MNSIDPMRRPDWPLLTAVTWAASRSPELVTETWGRDKPVLHVFLAGFAIEEAWHKVEAEDEEWLSFLSDYWQRYASGDESMRSLVDGVEMHGPHFVPMAFTNIAARQRKQLPEWEDELRLALVAGDLTVRATKDGAQDFVEVPPVEWNKLRVADNGTLEAVPGVARFRDALIAREAVLAAFPPMAETAMPSAREAAERPAGKKRGPKEKYPWDRFFAQCEVYFVDYAGTWDDGRSFIESPAPLEKLMAEWCANKAPKKHWGDGPGMTQLRKKVGEFLARKQQEVG